MKIDTIATDMDGTLLTPDRRISEYTLGVLEECKRRGIRLIPCSGRTHSSMRPYLELLDTGMPYIGGNGSEIIGADHQMIEQLTFDVPLAHEIIRAMQAEGFYVQVYGDDAFYFEAECTASSNYQKSSGMKGIAVGDLCRYLTFRTPKVLGVADPAQVERCYPIMQKRFEGRVTFTVSEVNFLEAEPLGASKGEALERLAKMRGDIVPERTLAFGDNLNDMALLAFTPHRVAMGNARQELKAFAAHVCGTNAEDGLAHFIEEYVLHQ